MRDEHLVWRKGTAGGKAIEAVPLGRTTLRARLALLRRQPAAPGDGEHRRLPGPNPSTCTQRDLEA